MCRYMADDNGHFICDSVFSAPCPLRPLICLAKACLSVFLLLCWLKPWIERRLVHPFDARAPLSHPDTSDVRHGCLFRRKRSFCRKSPACRETPFGRQNALRRHARHYLMFFSVSAALLAVSVRYRSSPELTASLAAHMAMIVLSLICPFRAILQSSSISISSMSMASPSSGLVLPASRLEHRYRYSFSSEYPTEG